MKNSEVAHEWANLSSRNHKAGNMYHEGTKLYSYGYHYLLGNLFPEKGVALINSRGYSTTTAAHKHHAIRALSGGWKIIMVPAPAAENKADHANNTAYFIKRREEIIDQMKRARNLGGYLLEYNNLKINYNTYCRAFSYKAPVLPGITETEHAIYAARAKRYETQTEARQEAKRAKRAAAEAKALDEWRQGKNSRAFYYSALALRLSADKKYIETSRGAKVGLIAARKLYEAWKAGENVTGRHIDSFTIDTVTTGVITIGCHDIPVIEIEKIFNK